MKIGSAPEANKVHELGALQTTAHRWFSATRTVARIGTAAPRPPPGDYVFHPVPAQPSFRCAADWPLGVRSSVWDARHSLIRRTRQKFGARARNDSSSGQSMN